MFIRYKNFFGKGGDLIDWDIENVCGYKPITTYFSDFSIADRFGVGAIKDTYARARKQAIKMGYKWLTELVMALNWKIFEHAETNQAYAQLYNELFFELSEYAQGNLTGEELEYYYRTTD